MSELGKKEGSGHGEQGNYSIPGTLSEGKDEWMDRYRQRWMKWWSEPRLMVFGQNFESFYSSKFVGFSTDL